MMDAVLLAGGIPQSGDFLFDESKGKSKALIDVAGKPMAQWVLDAISGSSMITKIIVIGVEASSGLHSKKPLTFLPDAGGLMENTMTGITFAQEQSPATTHVILSTTDIPTITSEMVDWRIRDASGQLVDLDYVVVERSTMEKRYPESKRSFVRLQDVVVCGGDLNIVSLKLIEYKDLWDRLVAARKSVRRQAAMLGYDILLRLLTRTITLEQAVQKIGGRLGIKGRAVISPYAELAMDVDKPEQLALVRRELEHRIGN